MNVFGLLSRSVTVLLLAGTSSLFAQASVQAQGTSPQSTTGLESAAIEPVSGGEIQSAVQNTAPDLSDRFLPPPGLTELNEITKTAIVSPRQRKTNRRLVISLQQRRVYVYENDDLMVSYPVAIGKDGWETPKGTWEVDQMIQNPSWQHPWTGEIVPPGPDNPLGRRWIGFWTDGVNAIGFHGTPNENLVGQAVSHGCVRMKNAHIEAMFRQIAMGATVEVK